MTKPVLLMNGAPIAELTFVEVDGRQIYPPRPFRVKRGQRSRKR